MGVKAQDQEGKRRKRQVQRHWWLWIFLLLIGVGILSLPGAMGIYAALLPARGQSVAALAAVGFELFSIFIAFLVVNGGLSRGLRNVLLLAFCLASLLNVLADYTYRIPGSMNDFATLMATFNGLALSLALVEGISVAGLAFAGVILMKFYHELNPMTLPLPIPEPSATPIEPSEAAAPDTIQENSRDTRESQGMSTPSAEVMAVVAGEPQLTASPNPAVADGTEIDRPGAERPDGVPSDVADTTQLGHGDQPATIPPSSAEGPIHAHQVEDPARADPVRAEVVSPPTRNVAND